MQVNRPGGKGWIPAQGLLGRSQEIIVSLLRDKLVVMYGEVSWSSKELLAEDQVRI